MEDTKNLPLECLEAIRAFEEWWWFVDQVKEKDPITRQVELFSGFVKRETLVKKAITHAKSCRQPTRIDSGCQTNWQKFCRFNKNNLLFRILINLAESAPDDFEKKLEELWFKIDTY